MKIAMTQKRKILFIIFFVIGTGCLLALLWKQDRLLQRMSVQADRSIAQFGFAGSDTVAYYDRQELDIKEKWAVKAAPVLAYLSGEQDGIEPRKDKDTSRFAMLYPGKNIGKGVWSGAAGHWYRGNVFLSEENMQRAGEGSEQQDNTTENAQEASAEVDADAAVLNKALQENQKYSQSEKKEQKQETLIAGGGEDNDKKIQHLKRTMSLNYLLRNFYIVDSSTSVDKKIFDVEALLNTEFSMKKKNQPQIYIFHTHGASEHFSDSKPGDRSQSIVGVGTYLSEILEKKYGYQVIHDETEYDRINGKIDRNKAYNKAAKGLKKTLKKYPSIQVVIDLHRDGVGNNVHRLTKVNGKKTAQIMFFNGLSRNRKGNIRYLRNDNLQANLAFSLQMKLKCMELYPNLAKPVYLKSYRYNLHMRKRSLLIELGNENNTLSEAKNAMDPLAKVLDQVLSQN